MGYSLEDLKELSRERGNDPNELSSVTLHNVPQYLQTGVTMEKAACQSKKEIIINAVIHEGLQSENLTDRIEEYEEKMDEFKD